MSKTHYKHRLLLIRLSALGDVAILQPVLRRWAEANPDVQFILAGPPLLQPLFATIPNVQYEATQRHMSPRELYNHLSRFKPSLVVDMHHVLRTIGACWLFRLHRKRVVSIRKRCPRRIPTWQRYNQALARCGLPVDASSIVTNDACHYFSGLDSHAIASKTNEASSLNGLLVGIAPFAQHRGKVWPLKHTERLVDLLSQQGCRVMLFGSENERTILDALAIQYPNVSSMAGKGRFSDELEAIASLDVMVSMDSANMHFASCLGIPVVSVWGATHPDTGFYGWRQDPSLAVQADFRCRPCSKYGKRPCRFGDYRCLSSIQPEDVVNRIISMLPSATQ